IITVAGNGAGAYGADGGMATATPFLSVSDVTVDAAGALYIADAYRIRKVATDGVIRTVAGSGGASSTTNGDGGAATSASLGSSLRIAMDSTGSLYISDWDNARIRKVN